jgi:two-component system chemotaxis response regulator CheB
MAEVRVVKRWPRARTEARVAPSTPTPVPRVKPGSEVRLVVIGASTGGPPVLQTILARLPKPFPVPIVIVQHISQGFVQGLAEWLRNRTGCPVSVAVDGERIEPGRVYLAPDGYQMSIGSYGRLRCTNDPPENGLRPSVGCLFRSVASAYGHNAVGVLLTGMGRDGAEELKLMRERGAVTLAQDKESSVVFGMPGVAVELGAATYVLPPERIAMLLGELVKPRAPAIDSPS